MRQFSQFALVISINVLVAGCGGSHSPKQAQSSPPTEKSTETSQANGASHESASNVLPGIQEFLNEHPEFGSPSRTQSMPDWWQGKRQRIQLTNGRNLLFYLKDGKVVTVYENTRTESRKKIWGE